MPEERDPIFANEPEKPEYSLKKHKSIVHRTHLPTAFQEKIFNGFLLAAKVALKTNQGHPDRFFKEGFVTSEKYITNFAALKTNNREHILKSIDSIMDSALKFDFFHESDKFNELRCFAPISEVRYLQNGGLHFFLPPTLVELLSNPETFYTIDTQLTSRLTSVYSIAIYELGLIHMGGSVEFQLPELREYMGLEPTEYPTPNDLRRYVIDKGCSEVNLKCDIAVKYTMLKEGWGSKVKGVRFEFTPSLEPLEIPTDNVQLELVATFCAALPFNLSGELFVISILKKSLEEHGEDWVLSNVEAFLQRMSAPGQAPVKQPGALFRTTFKNDYGKDIRDAKKVAKILRTRKAKAPEPEASHEAQDDQVEATRLKNEKYLAHFNALSTEAQEEIRQSIRKDPRLIGPEEFKIVHYLSEVMGVEI